MSNLLLPGDPDFEITLGMNLPFGWESYASSNPDFCFVADADTGILRPANKRETEEYLYGGEYDSRLASIESDDCYY